MPFLSIIIPVYNVEAYLNACVDSILQQGLEDTEIILVDDGSPDGSPALCDAYAGAHENIRVIHKPNGGLSSARNAGLRAASGQYVMFVDSDDWWNPEVSVAAMLEQVKEHPKTEMFLFTLLNYVEGEGLFKPIEYEKIGMVRTDTVEHYCEDLLKNGNLEVSAGTKILKLSFLMENQLFFKEGIVSEDCEWMLRLLRKLQTVSIFPVPLYIYRMRRAGSITNTIGKRSIENLLGIVQSSLQYYENPEVNRDRMQYEYSYCAYLWFCALGLSGMVTAKEFKTLIPLFRSTSCVCGYGNSRKNRLAYTAYKLFGVRGARIVLFTYIKARNKLHLNKKKQNDVVYG